MINVSEIRNHLQPVLDGCEPLGNFEDWFASARRDIYKSSPVQARELAFAIDDTFSQYEKDSPAFREALKDL